MDRNEPRAENPTSDPDLPQSRSLDTTPATQPSQTPDTIPHLVNQTHFDLDPRTLDTSRPDVASGGLHIHIVFTGCAPDRLLRPVQTGVIDPDQIRLLKLTSSETPAIETQIRDRLPATQNIPIESHEIAVPAGMPELYTDAYKTLKSAVQSTDQDNHVSINLTTPSPLLSTAFFTAAATYVLEYPSHRPLLELYYVPPNEQDIEATIDSLLENQPDREQPRSAKPTEMLFEYAHTDLEDRFEQLETTWKTFADDRRTPSAVRDEITTTLDELRTAINHIESDTNPQVVHELEDTVWLLSDYVTDLRKERDEDPPTALASFQTEIDRLDTVISRLRTIVRDNRRLFTTKSTDTHSADQNKSLRSTLSQQLREPDIITTNNHTTPSGVHELPLPMADPRSIQQKEISQAILEALATEGAFDSVSALARHLVNQLDESYDESFRSKVQYNARTLVEKGLVTREQTGRSYRIGLSTTGKVWQQTD